MNYKFILLDWILDGLIILDCSFINLTSLHELLSYYMISTFFITDLYTNFLTHIDMFFALDMFSIISCSILIRQLSS